jgi:hypothetical protein
LAGTKRPSFLKSQKEQKRKAKALEKREVRANKRARAGEPQPEGAPQEEEFEVLDGPVIIEE